MEAIRKEEIIRQMILLARVYSVRSAHLLFEWHNLSLFKQDCALKGFFSTRSPRQKVMLQAMAIS